MKYIDACASVDWICVRLRIPDLPELSPKPTVLREHYFGKAFEIRLLLLISDHPDVLQQGKSKLDSLESK